MNSYKVPYYVTKKVEDIELSEKQKESVNNINSALDNVAQKYAGSNQSSVPNKIELERMEFQKPTEQEIYSQSENSLKEYKQAGIKEIEDDYKLKEDKLYSNKSELIESNNNAKQNLENYYSNAVENAENQALKRGLARSSIIVNQLDAFEKEKIADYKALDKELSDQINTINFELNALTSQKQNALNNFDITYAVKLQEKINSLNKELSEKENEVVKYNNEISIKEAEFNKDVDELKNEIAKSNWEDVVDVMEIYGKYGQNVVNKVKSDEIYNEAKKLLKNLSKDEIAYVLQDEGFKLRLGDNYAKLIEELS